MVGESRVVKDSEGRQFIVYDNGILVGSHDLDGISGALDYLMNNQEQGHKMGRIGRTFALESFGLDRLIDGCSPFIFE